MHRSRDAGTWNSIRAAGREETKNPPCQSARRVSENLLRNSKSSLAVFYVEQVAFRNVTIVLRNYGAALRSRMVIDEMTARYMIEDESMTFQESNDFARSNGGKLRHIRGQARRPRSRRRLESALRAS